MTELTILLRGKRVLVVEDEPLIAMMLEDMLSELGMVVLGPQNCLEDGLMAAKNEIFDIAILDMNLNGRRSYPIADLLNAQATPFIFATGYDGREHAYGDAEVIEKPYRLDQLLAALKRTLLRMSVAPS